MRTGLIAIASIVLQATTTSAAAPLKVELLEVRKIWDQAPHNAFTDLTRWNDQSCCAFRERHGHVSADGRIRVLSSKDADTWSPTGLIPLDRFDLRDARLSVVPDGRLMLPGGAAPQKPAGKQSTAEEPIHKSLKEEAGRTTARISRVSELLDKYAANQDKLNSFICKWEASTRANALLTEPPYTALSGKSQRVKLTESRCDGSRYSEEYYTWGNVTSARDFIRKERASYNSRLWDGQRFFNYTATTNRPGRLTIYLDVSELPAGMQIEHQRNLAGLDVILVRGFSPIDDERVDSALRKVQTVSMDAATEKIGGSECYSIHAEDSSKKCTIWFDPAHGYNIAKGQVQYKDSDLLLSQENIRFERIGDFWIIAEAVVRRTQKFRKGNFTDDTTVYGLIEMKINPDHGGLSSFRPDDIATGTTVLFQGEAWKKTHSDIRTASGRMTSRMRSGVMTFFNDQGKVVSYIWRDGKIMDEERNVVADFLNKDARDSKNDAKR